MQIPTTYSETFDLVDKAREEARQAAQAAIRAHIARIQAPGTLSDPAHPFHQGYIQALDFACTLVMFS
jgi:hypothetical protein